VDPNEQAPELTHRLFRLGSALLLEHLPAVLSGEAQLKAKPQAHEEASHAAKVEQGSADVLVCYGRVSAVLSGRSTAKGTAAGT